MELSHNFLLHGPPLLEHHLASKVVAIGLRDVALITGFLWILAKYPNRSLDLATMNPGIIVFILDVIF